MLRKKISGILGRTKAVPTAFDLEIDVLQGLEQIEVNSSINVGHVDPRTKYADILCNANVRIKTYFLRSFLTGALKYLVGALASEVLIRQYLKRAI